MANSISPDLKRLKELVGYQGSAVGESMEYAVRNGECISRGILTKPAVAVIDSFMPSGSFFPEHAHDATEIHIIYKGRVRFVGDVERVAGPSEVAVINPGEPHTAEALEDAWLVSITIPSDPGYPHER